MVAGRSYINLSELVKDKHTLTHTYVGVDTVDVFHLR